MEHTNLSPLQNDGSKREFWLDLARAVAIIAVTCNHAVSRTFTVYEDTAAEWASLPLLLSLFKVAVYVFSRVGVPLFFMISGALLLRRDFTKPGAVGRFYRRNLLPLLLTAEIWYTLMYWYLSLGASSTLRTEGLLPALVEYLGTLLFLNQRTFSSMWFIPVILCLYLLVPAVSLAVQKLPRWAVLVPCLTVVLSVMVIPDINAWIVLLGGTFQFSFSLSGMYLFSVYLCYLILGYCLANGLLSRVPTVWVVLGGLFAFLFTCGYQAFGFMSPYSLALSYTCTGVMAFSAFTFEWLRRVSPRFAGITKPVTYLSRISLGIYFLHICIMTGLVKVTGGLALGYLPRFLLLELLSLGGSVLLIALTARIPLFKRYVWLIKDENHVERSASQKG